MIEQYVKVFRYCLLFISWFGLSEAVPAQVTSLETEYFSVNDGLSDRLINDILLSKHGLIWLATENGLNRFDGYNFRVFNNDPKQTAGRYLSGNNIQDLIENEAGSIYILYKNEIVFFDIFDPISLVCKKKEILPKQGIKGVTQDIKSDKNGTLFFLTSQNRQKHIYTYNLKKDTFELITSLKKSYHKDIKTSYNELLPTSNGFFFINDSHSGLNLYDSGGNLIKHFSKSDFNTTDENFLYPRHTYFMHQDKESRIWLSFSNNTGVYIFNPIDIEFNMVGQLPSGKFFTNIWEDQLGNVLFPQTPEAGIHPQTDMLFCISSSGEMLNFSHLTQASNNIISCGAKDFFKTIFFGIDTGLKVVKNNKTKVKTFLAKNLDQDRRGAVMRGITADSSDIIYFAREANHWYALDTETDILDTLQLIDEDSGQKIEFGCGTNLIYDTKGFLWGSGCSSDGTGMLLRYDLVNCSTKTYLYPDQIRVFNMDESGVIWVGCQDINGQSSLIKFRPETGNFIGFWDIEGKNPFINAMPRFILPSQDKLLWVGTENGLFCINKSDATVLVYTKESEKDQPHLSSNVIYTIHEDKKGLIWLGTQKGLNILDPVNKKINYFTTDDGLSNNSVAGILPTEAGNYWISTFNGLSFFDSRIKSFKRYFKRDGFSHNEFNRFSFFKDRKGRFYLGGVNGINAFYPDELFIKKEIPSVILTNIGYHGKADSLFIKEANLTYLNELTFSPYDNNYHFDFSLPLYSDSRKNQFQFYMENYDKDWTTPSTNHSIRYNKLPAGTYILHAKGADPNGNWSSQNTSLKITIKRVFYKTPLFISLLIIALLVLLYGFFQYKLEQKLKVERLRTRLASDLHDELSGLLTGIAMQTDILSGGAHDNTLKNRLKKIGSDSRSAISRMNDVIWSIDSRKDKLEDFIIRMREHADEILLPLEISYEISSSKIEPNQKMRGRIKQELYFIYKEIINNVAKHSNASHVKISLKNNGQLFKMLISDNGQGRKNTKMIPKSGQGMENLKMRAERLNAQLTFLEDNGLTVILAMDKFLK